MSIPVKTVLELACAAFRINGYYTREDVWEYDQNGNATKHVLANKQMMKNCIESGDFSEITDLDREKADCLVEHFRKHYLFRMLSGQLSDFSKQLSKLAISESLIDPNSRDRGQYHMKIGMLAYAPAMYDRDQTEFRLSDTGRANGQIDQPVRSRIAGKFECMQIFNSRDMFSDSKLHKGLLDNRYAVRFWTSNPFEENQTYNITARIKGFDNNKVFTSLNYVRIVEDPQ